jgi:hypothetical protein
MEKVACTWKLMSKEETLRCFVELDTWLHLAVNCASGRVFKIWHIMVAYNVVCT